MSGRIKPVTRVWCRRVVADPWAIFTDPKAKAVALVLWTRVDATHATLTDNRKYIAERAGVTEAYVGTVLDALVTVGLLKPTGRSDRFGAAEYKMLDPESPRPGPKAAAA